MAAVVTAAVYIHVSALSVGLVQIVALWRVSSHTVQHDSIIISTAAVTPPLHKQVTSDSRRCSITSCITLPLVHYKLHQWYEMYFLPVCILWKRQDRYLVCVIVACCCTNLGHF